MGHSLVGPDANLCALFGQVRDRVGLKVFVEFDIGNLDGMVEQRDSAVTVNGSGFAQAEDVIGGRIRLRRRKRRESAVASGVGFREADVGDLLGLGVDLMVVVAIYLFLRDSADGFLC